MNHYQTMQSAINYIDANYLEQPNLKAIASHVGISEFHFQKLFKQYIGISPKKFLQAITAVHTKPLLLSQFSTLDTALEAGLSGNARLHELMVNFYAMSPGQIKRGGAGLKIEYEVMESWLGTCLIARTQVGICLARFLDADTEPETIIKSEWPHAEVKRGASELKIVLHQWFNDLKMSQQLNFHLQGSNFQLKIWEALIQIPLGHTVSYSNLASRVGHPKGARAVGNAVGSNPVAMLIPCHRVIRQTGTFGNYRWGAERKRKLLAWEQSRAVE